MYRAQGATSSAIATHCCDVLWCGARVGLGALRLEGRQRQRHQAVGAAGVGEGAVGLAGLQVPVRCGAGDGAQGLPYWYGEAREPEGTAPALWNRRSRGTSTMHSAARVCTTCTRVARKCPACNSPARSRLPRTRSPHCPPARSSRETQTPHAAARRTPPPAPPCRQRLKRRRRAGCCRHCRRSRQPRGAAEAGQGLRCLLRPAAGLRRRHREQGHGRTG